ncbi:MAG: hypothetical protein ACPH45_03360 [Porticoccaceae bacterium]
MDRIDLHIPVNSIDNSQLIQGRSNQTGESNTVIRQRVCQARSLQLCRQGITNSRLNNQQLKQVCPLNLQQQKFLDKAIDRYSLSARGYHRLLKLARSIADLAGVQTPDICHYQEALSYRSQFNAAK